MTDENQPADPADEARALAGVDLKTLPQGKTFWWFGESTPMVFERRSQSPLKEEMAILEMFQDDHEVRVYELPHTEGKAGADGKREPLFARRVTLSKSDPTMFIEVMAPETFVALLTDEFKMLAEACTMAEQERDAIVAHLMVELPGAISLMPEGATRDAVEAHLEATLDEIRRGEHREADDEDEPEPKPNGQGVEPGRTDQPGPG